MDESTLLQKWFLSSDLQPHEAYIVQKNGDDGAVLGTMPEYLVQSIDTYVADHHFPAHAPAHLIGQRALSASVSDLAAMGAIPHSFSFALTTPTADNSWLSDLHQSLKKGATNYHMTLLGGDLTAGPLTLTFHVQGLTTHKTFLTRTGAQPGDRIFVSNTLGDSGGALPFVKKASITQCQAWMEDGHAIGHLLHAYYAPQPQIQLAQWLIQHRVRTAIDISDGLFRDLGHILNVSCVGARIHLAHIPLSSALCTLYDREQALHFACSSGDDYQLCFCWPQHNGNPPLSDCPVPITEIGVITTELGLRDIQGTLYPFSGYSHF